MRIQDMKQTLFIFAALLLHSQADAQIFKSRYERALSRYEKRAAKELQGGGDFTLDPIEAVPQKTTKRLTIQAQTNWGKDLLLPAALRNRLATECTYKVVVKVADTGQPDHTALKQGQLPGANYTTAGSAADIQGHSTHVSGIIAGDEVGILDALVDKGLVTHKAVKILGDNGSGSFTWVATAVAAERASDQRTLQDGGFVVWNGSFGGGTSLIESVEAELKRSTDLGVVFCFAAGNTGGAGVNYPGNGKYSIACASLDQGLSRSSYSTTGAEVWAAMPGRGINSTYKGQAWAVLSGTSMATPFLTAATAVAFSKWGAKLNGKVKPYLAWCCKDLGAAGKDNETGWGLALIENILNRNPIDTPGLPDNPPPPPPTPGDSLLSITPLYVALQNSYAVNWSNVSAAAGKSTASTMKIRKNSPLAATTTQVWFELSAPSTGSAGSESARLEKAVEKYFQGRGFLLPKGQDASWAALWAAYFLEMGLDQTKWPVKVKKVRFKSSGSTFVEITDPQLKHWKQ